MAIHKNLPQTSLHETKIGTISISGISITGASFVRVFNPVMSANTDYVVYTCPSGKKALMMGRTVRNIGVGPTPTVTPQGTPGATSWSYVVSPVGNNGVEYPASAAGSTASGNATLDGTNFNRVSWSAYLAASSYNVYRTVAGGTPSDVGLIGNTASTTLDDTGITPTGSAHRPGGTSTLLHKFNDGVNPDVSIGTITGITVNALVASMAYGPAPVLEAGQIYKIRPDTYGLSHWREIVVCDDVVPISTKWLTSFSVGYNTLYTVPAGKTALLLPTVASTVSGVGTSALAPRLIYWNYSGGSRSIAAFHVPSDNSAGFDNMLLSATVLNIGVASSNHEGGAMQAGDSIVVKTDSVAAGQVAYVNVLEI